MKSYPAEMFRAGSGARAVRGTLEVGARTLRFRSDEDTLEMSLPGVICRLSGYDNRTFFFSHPEEEGAEIAVKAPEIRHDPTLQALPIFAEAQRVGRATHFRFWGCIALLGLGALTILLRSLSSRRSFCAGSWPPEPPPRSLHAGTAPSNSSSFSKSGPSIDQEQYAAIASSAC